MALPGGIGFNNALRSINVPDSASPYFNNLGVDNFVGQPGASQPFDHPGDLQTFLTNPATGKGAYHSSCVLLHVRCEGSA